jgi:hypothetical protein
VHVFGLNSNNNVTVLPPQNPCEGKVIYITNVMGGTLLVRAYDDSMPLVRNNQYLYVSSPYTIPIGDTVMLVYMKYNTGGLNPTIYKGWILNRMSY